jgi:DNA-binding PadR family transcriptional regulator
MPIQHAVLALLARGPSHGYELKAIFEEAIGPQWGELNIGHLYQALDRLVRDGLAKKSAVAQADRPDKNVYRITVAGSRALDGWLGTPFVRQAGYRDDFFLKLFAASLLGPDRIRAVTATQRTAYLDELAALGELRLRHDSAPLVRLLIEAAVLQTQANLRVVEMADEHAEAIARAAVRVAVPSEQSRRKDAATG